VHHEPRLVRTFPLHPTTTPASSMLLHAVRTIHGNPHTPRPRPIPNSLHPPLCCYRSIFDWSLGMMTFLRCIALWMVFGAQSGSATCHAIHLHGLNTLFPNPLWFLCNVMVFLSLTGVTSPPDTIEMDGASRRISFRSSNLLPPLTLFLFVPFASWCCEASASKEL
jgi:hypothetical protein